MCNSSVISELCPRSLQSARCSERPVGHKTVPQCWRQWCLFLCWFVLLFLFVVFLCWVVLVFVCRKCLKRSDDAKTIGRALKSEVKRHAGDREKPARVIKTSCFGICPKRAVVVTGGAAAR